MPQPNSFIFGEEFLALAAKVDAENARVRLAHPEFVHMATKHAKLLLANAKVVLRELDT
jgi:hypothetical protein